MSDIAGCPSGLAPPSTNKVTADPNAFVQAAGDDKQLELAVSGAKCAGCISKIEAAVGDLPGVSSARLNLSTGKLSVHWAGELNPKRITQSLLDIGYHATPFDPSTVEDDDDAYGRELMKCLAVAGFAMANIMLLSVGVWASSNGEMGDSTRSFMHLVSGVIAIPAALFAGQPFFKSAWSALRSGSANMDVPISLAVILALSASLFEAFQHGEHAYFDAAVMLLFFLLIGRWLDHQLRRKARSAARDLIAMQAVTVTRLIPDGSGHAVAAKDILPGDHLLINPGDRLPVNGRIIAGRSDCDMSLLTGESEPVTVDRGAKLSAGVINITQTITVEATTTAANSLLADIVRMVEAGQQAKSRIVRLADKASRLYVPVVHTLAAATFIGWFFFAQAGVRESLMAAIALLIITCPCALGLATPAVQIVATGRLFKQGILVKAGDALERLAQVNHIVFDKTGTLTLGTLAWANTEDVPETQRKALGQIARTSRHPIARAVATQLGAGPHAPNAKDLPGEGIICVIDGIEARLGRAAFVGIESANAPLHDGPVSWFKLGDQAPIQLRFDDVIRPNAKTTIDHFKRAGMKISLLSGDHPDAVKRVARDLDIKDWAAQLSPADKTDHLAALKKNGALIAMVGDGLNDTAALAHAHTALTPGTAAEAAQSAADYVFQGESLSPIWTAHQMAKRSQRHVIQNFGFAALYNVIAAPIAMAGWVTPLIAAIAMSGSSLIVTLNAIRLNKEGASQ